MSMKDYEMKDEAIRCWGIYIPDSAAEQVAETLKSKWINTGKKEKEFREKIRDRFNAPFAAACTNGTAALKIAMRALDVGPDDEVISTPYTFPFSPTN